MDVQKIRVRKSVRFEKTELTKLKNWVAKQETKMDAAEIIGVSRQALDMIMARGSSKEAIITKIRTIINA